MPADSPDAWVLEFKNVTVHLYSFVVPFYIHCVLPPWMTVWRCQIPWNWNYRQLWTAIWLMGIEPWSLGRAVLLTIEPSLQSLLLKITICSHLYYTGICHIFKVCFCYYFLQHLCTNKALQSHNSTGMVLCKSFNIDLENGEVLLLETCVVPFHSHLQMELWKGIRHEGWSHLSTTLSAKLDLTL